jgi:hypothetical protein
MKFYYGAAKSLFPFLSIFFQPAFALVISPVFEDTPSQLLFAKPIKIHMITPDHTDLLLFFLAWVKYLKAFSQKGSLTGPKITMPLPPATLEEEQSNVQMMLIFF